MDLIRFIGIPYEGDRFCAVLAARILAEHGIPYPDVDRPEDAADWARVDQPQPLDVVVFNVKGRPGHVGVCIGDDKFIHAEWGSTSRIERLSSPFRAPRIEGFYRYRP